MQSLDVWIKYSDVSGSLTYTHCPPATPTCQPSKTLPLGFNKNPTLPVWTKAHVSTETTINQARAQSLPRPKQYLQYLRPQASLRLPKLRRCKALRRKLEEAPREGTRSTAMPLAIHEAPLTPQHSTSTCQKNYTLLLMPQEAAMLHPN